VSLGAGEIAQVAQPYDRGGPGSPVVRRAVQELGESAGATDNTPTMPTASAPIGSAKRRNTRLQFGRVLRIYLHHGSRCGHPLIAVLPAGGDTLSGTFDILAILRYLKSLGIITGNEYLSGWELGVETISGSGSMTVNQLSYTWN
jgi:hypothetical protein